MYQVLSEWINGIPVTIKLKDGTTLVIEDVLEVHEDCVELLEKNTGDIYLLQKENILFAKLSASDIPED